MHKTKGGNNIDLTESNRSAVVSILHRRKVCSRADIARETGLTQPAITKIVAALMDMGIVSEIGGIKGSRNRRSIGLSLNTDRYLIMGIRFSRQIINMGLFDLSGKVCSLEDMPYTAQEAPLDVLNALKEKIRGYIRSYPRIVAVGFALPGPYLHKEGYIAVITQMPSWRDVNFRKELEHAFERPVFIEHDANAGALAEWYFGNRGPQVNSLAYFLVGEGVGSGIIANGNLLLGAQGCASEMGHISVDVHGPVCECGNHGCLEMYCSAPALVKKALKAAPDAFEGLPHTCETVFSLARSGNEAVQKAVKEVAEYIAFGCVSLIYAYNPDLIVLGDSVAAGRELILPVVQQAVAERVLPALYEKMEIKLSDLSINPTLLGAAAAAANKVLQNPSVYLTAKV